MGQPSTLKVYYPPKGAKPTQGTETSKYLEEKKIIMIPQVVASEKGTAQTHAACRTRVVGLHLETTLK
jgi:hypothetical protein